MGAMRRRAAVGPLLIGVLVLAGCGGSEPAVEATSSASTVAAASGTTVLDGQRLTVLDQAISYPSGKGARISSEIVELQPGQQTGWLRQRTPTFVYVLSGTWSEEYDAGVTKDFAAGTGFMQAQGVWHNGSNSSQEVARVLVVHLGAKGVKDTARR